MSRPCPHCEADSLAPASPDGVQRCPACGRSALAPLDSSEPTPSEGSRRFRRAPGEVPSGPAALGGVVLTAVFYGLLGLMPEGRLGELFLERGTVPYVITGVSAWALLLLAARWRRLRGEWRLLDRDFLAEAVPTSAGRISVAGAGQALQTLAIARGAHPDSFLLGRLERALRHFQARGRVAEVVDVLAAESASDEGRVEASYALIRVFVWAVPTLGFIGTVIGIGTAVGGFSETLEAAASLDAMKESIGGVTGGLGVAFDTTLLALVMSILIMFPASAVQRMEEGLVGAVDDYCAERLVLRLEDDGRGESAAIRQLAERLAEALGRSAEKDA